MNYQTAFTVEPCKEVPDGCYIDPYGQIQMKTKWYAINTWAPRYKTALYGFATSTAGCYIMSRFQRRPIYANLTYKIPLVAAVTVGMYVYGRYTIERKFSLRDATINHYVELHPQDFEIIKSKGRKFRDILMPWEPYRGQEKTVPLLSGIRPTFPKDPAPSTEETGAAH